jgi:SSS family solute:Na+ symporter
MLDLGITLYTAAIALEVMSGWGIAEVVLGIGLITTLYTMVGGIEGVVWTDVIQGFVLIGGMLLILAILLVRPEGGPAAVLATAWQGGKFSLGDFDLSWRSLFGGEATVWVWLVAGLVMLGRTYTIDQNIVQRYLLARSDREAQSGALLGAISCLPIWMTFMLIGACLWSFYRLSGVELPADVVAKPDNVLPYFVATQLPSGVVGAILAAILAAAQSSVSADLNSISTVVTAEYFTHFRRGAADRVRLAFGRWVVLVGGLSVTGIALVLTKTRAVSAVEVSIILVTVVAGGMLGLFALGFLTRRATARGASAGIVACVLFTAWATFTGPLKFDLGFNYPFHELLIGAWSQVVLFVVGYGASLALGAERATATGLTMWDFKHAAAAGADRVEGIDRAAEGGRLAGQPAGQDREL